MINKKQLIAVVGASADKNKYGYRIFHDLYRNGYRVVGVNPKRPIIDGQQTVSQLKFIKPKPDLIVVVTPPPISKKILMAAASLKIKQVWLQPGAESPEVIDLAKKLRLSITTNACFMIKEKIWSSQ